MYDPTKPSFANNREASECELPSVTETYRGAPARSAGTPAVRADGAPSAYADDPGKLAKKARKAVDVILLDDEQRPRVTARIMAMTKAQAATNDGAPLPHGQRMDVLMRFTDSVGTRPPEVGDTAWVWGMNRWRRGILTKINAKRAEVAYTTSSSNGRIYRPVRAFADIWVEG